MTFNFDEPAEHTDLRAAVRNITKRFDDEYWRRCDQESAFPWAFYTTMADAGWLALLAPKKLGGGGLGVAEACVVMEEVATSGAAMAGCTALHPTIFAMNLVVQFGAEALQREVLPRMADGSLHVSFAITEPDSGSDMTRVTTTARSTSSGDFSVSGQKVWISKSTVAESMLILVRTTPRDQVRRASDGLTLLFADVDRSAVEVRPIDKMGRAAVDSSEVFFEDLHVPAHRVVGEVGQGFRTLLHGLNAERIVIAAEALGLGRCALAAAVTYAKERHVFGRPIGQNQGIQFPLAQSLIELDAAALLTQKAAWMYDQGRPCGPEANSAKYLCASAAFRAADRAVQTLGGFGYAKEFHVERYFRESRIMRIAPVSEELILANLAHDVLGLKKSY